MTRRMLCCAVLGLLAGLAQAQPAECAAATPTPGRWLVQGDGFRVLYSPRPAPIRVGEHFGLDITLCARKAGMAPPAMKLDADMPAHRHGMNYRPTLQPQGGGQITAQGLMFHMSGRWRLIFDLSDDQGTVRLTHEIDIE